MWDLRNVSKAVATAKDLPNMSPHTGATLSPDGRFIVTGVSQSRANTEGALALYTFPALEPVRSLPMGNTHVTSVVWHSRINQIFAGTGTGAVAVLYNPQASARGVLMCVTKHPKRRDYVDDFQVDRPIVTPNALPAFRELV